MVVGGYSWLASCWWVVVGSCFWLAMVVLSWPCWWIGLWCFYYSEIDYFIVVNISFYCNIYIILLC